MRHKEYAKRLKIINFSAVRQSINQMVVIVGLVLLYLLSSNTAYSQTDHSLLADNYPERYNVVEGDTLWDISGKFLNSPWRWPEVWQGNPQVENPDLIYPGDVLILTFMNGRPVLRSLRSETVTVKLSPTVRGTDYLDAIPPIDPSAIQAYINSPLVTNEQEILEAGYIVEGVAKRLIMGKYDQFYARALTDQTFDKYRIFRPGREFIDPVSKEPLGWEAVHVGDARMLQAGDPARLTILSTHEDVSIRDRLRPVEIESGLPFFYPQPPRNSKIRGMILQMPHRSTEVGPLTVVAINLGEREGVEPGNVFRILSQAEKRKDPMTGETYRLPEEKIGLLMVFRTFEKVSYAIVTNSAREVKPLDVLVSPFADKVMEQE